MRYHSSRLPRFRRKRKIARRRNCGLMGRLPWAGSRHRRNPDPNGAPWGPDLYNPLEDEDHPFKDESEYRSVTKSLYRRNPYRRNPYGYVHDSSEAGQSGLYTSIFSRSRRNRRQLWNQDYRNCRIQTDLCRHSGKLEISS